MFEVGFTEIVLILGIALLVLGPERLPKLAADIGRWAGKARAMARQLKNQLEQEAGALNDLRNPLDDLRNPLGDTPPKSQTIHPPPPATDPAPAPQAAPAVHAAAAATEPATEPAANPPNATPDVTDESKPA
jgi:sec-independent protein translocase protein TatB